MKEILHEVEFGLLQVQVVSIDFRAKRVLHATGFSVESDVIVWDGNFGLDGLLKGDGARGIKKIKS